MSAIDEGEYRDALTDDLARLAYQCEVISRTIQAAVEHGAIPENLLLPAEQLRRANHHVTNAIRLTLHPDRELAEYFATQQTHPS